MKLQEKRPDPRLPGNLDLVPASATRPRGGYRMPKAEVGEGP